MFLILIVLSGFAKTQAQITSSFDTDDEGWTAINSQTGPTPAHVTEGGNPNGFIQVKDAVGGPATFFIAPEKFLGNLTTYYGGILKFDLQVYIAPNSSTAGVRLTGGGLALVKLLPNLPAIAPVWTSYSFILSDAEGWRLTSPTGNIATQADIETVLNALTELQINGEYSTSFGDEGGLDNVTITPATLPELVIYTALSPNDDLANDSWFIANIDGRDDTRENTVKIFNRWGDLVWEGTNYNNTTVLFTGADKNQKKLLPGTYFYTIEYPSGRKQQAGFISLRR